jgi:predicted nucleotidyltransferase
MRRGEPLLSHHELAAAMVPPDIPRRTDIDLRKRPAPALLEEVTSLMPSPRQRAVMARIVRVIAVDRQVKAAWLAGSLARGHGDAFSDIDVIALVALGEARHVGTKYAARARRLGRLSLVRTKMDNRVVNVITGAWDRFDLRFIDEDELPEIGEMTLLPLWGDTESLPSVTGETDRSASPEAVVRLVCEFFRVLGLAVVAVQREEWLLAQSGVNMMKQLTIDLLLEGSAINLRRGGALRLNAFLSRDQRLALEALPVPSADRPGIIAANMAVARMFVPLARELAARIAADWPTAFEAATRRHLREHLGVELGV